MMMPNDWFLCVAGSLQWLCWLCKRSEFSNMYLQYVYMHDCHTILKTTKKIMLPVNMYLQELQENNYYNLRDFHDLVIYGHKHLRYTHILNLADACI